MTLYYTLQLGIHGAPLQEGGTGPDEPIWYFDEKSEFDKSCDLVQILMLQATASSTDVLPEYEVVTDHHEFGQYAIMQTIPGPGTTLH